jgi:hypothetical protein
MSIAKKITESFPDFSYDQAFSRNIGVLTHLQQQKLKNACIAIPGCGGVGGAHALALARLGVGKFKIADFDIFEVQNFNRQVGAKISTIGEVKTDVTRRDILDINPTADVEVFPKGVHADTIDQFLDGVDVVIDSLDFFAFRDRQRLFREARRRGIPVITAGPLAFTSAIMTFTKDSMGFDEYFGWKDDDPEAILSVKFAVGLAPKGLHLSHLKRELMNLGANRGPSCSPGVLLCCAWAASAAVNIILGDEKVLPAPYYQQFDLKRGRYARGYLLWGAKNPLMKVKLWIAKRFFLKK